MRPPRLLVLGFGLALAITPVQQHAFGDSAPLLSAGATFTGDGAGIEFVSDDGEPPPELTVSTTSATFGQTVTVTLTNGSGGAQDWLALAATSSPDNVCVTWIWVGTGATTRTWTVAVPLAAGQYEFRLF